jgi:hypothetical protein
MALAVSFDMRLGTRQVLLDQCGDFAWVHGMGSEWLERSV